MASQTSPGTPYRAIPMSPSLADEKTAFLQNDEEYDQEDGLHVGRQSSSKLVRLLVALHFVSRIALVGFALFGFVQLINKPSLIRFAQTNDEWNVSPPSHSPPHGHRPHGPPHHGPGQGPPGKLPPFPRPHPKANECFDISDAKAAVNFTVTLKHAGAPVHLSPSLDSTDIVILADKADKGLWQELDGFPHHPPTPPPPPRMPHMPHGYPHPPPPPPPPHMPHGIPGRPPHGPHPGPPDRPHFPPGKPHMPHGPIGHPLEPQVIMIEAKRTKSEESGTFVTSDSFEDAKKSLFICSLDFPFGQVGLGLFRESPKEHDKQPDDMPSPPPPSSSSDDEHKEKKPKQPKHESFPDISLAIHHPAGEPFTLTSGLPLGPPRLPWGEHHFAWGSKKGERKGVVVVVTKFTKAMGCAGRRLMSKITRST